MFFNFEITKDFRDSGAIKVVLNEQGVLPVITLQPVSLLPETKIIVEIIPESGFIVGKVPNIIYFNATDLNKEITEFIGKLFAISDPENLILDEIKTLHRGKGKFEFTPNPHEIYYIRVYFRNGPTQDINLPKCDSQKVILMSTPNSIFQSTKYNNIKYQPFELIIFNGSEEKTPSNLNIRLRMKENLIFEKGISVSAGRNIFTPETLGIIGQLSIEGIAILTLISGSKVLGERLIYIHPGNILKV